MPEQRRVVIESDPGPIAIAEQQLEFQLLADAHMVRLAGRLLSEPQINADCVGSDSPDAKPEPQERSIDDLLNRVAPRGLTFFECGVDAEATFRIEPEHAAGFLSGLLGLVSKELARRQQSTQGPPPTLQSTAPARLPRGLDEFEEFAGDFGIFSGESTGNLYELDSETASLTSRARAEQLHCELFQVLEHLSEGNEQGLKDVRRLRRLTKQALDDVTSTETPDLIVPVFHVVDATFTTYAGDVPTSARQAYTGIVATLAGFARGSLEPEAARERTRKALARAKRGTAQE